MLVLRRKPRQTIHLVEIGVTITLLDAWTGAATIGIEAPETITISRGELMPSAAEEGSDDAAARQ